MGVAGKEMRGNCCSGVQRNALRDEKCPILAEERESFLPEEAARELEDLLPDSKLWERPPLESELEAAWV